MWACSCGHADIALDLLRDPRVDRHIKYRGGSNALALAHDKGLTAVVTLIEVLDRGDERMPLVKVHHRYPHGDRTAEGAQAQAQYRQAPHPPVGDHENTCGQEPRALYLAFPRTIGRFMERQR